METDKALLLLASVLSQERFSGAANAFTCELAALMRVDEVAVGFDDNGGATVAAISRRADFKGESELVQALAAAMDEALIQRHTVTFPPAKGSAQITLAHAELVRSHGVSAFTVPMANDGRIFGAVTLLRSGSDALTGDEIAGCENLVCLAGPILELKRNAEKPWHQRLGRSLTNCVKTVFGPGQWRAKGLTALSAAVLASLTLLPVGYHVTSPARLEGAVQASLVAPADGFLRHANVRPGDRVTANQVLAELSQEDLLLERRKWESAHAQHNNAAPAALARADRGQYIIDQAKADEARAEMELIDAMLVRSRIIAPFKGILIEGDLTQSLGAPVRRGDVLMVIAPAGEFRLIVEVDERDIAALGAGQHGELTLGAMTERTFDFVVERVTPVANARDGRNFFEVVALLNSDQPSLQPGLRGIARINVGERTLAWIWTHGAIDWLSVKLWSWGF
jgi:multidrug efflux pump subunit AcrA (membrane-fusion protein)